jgi:epoxyqueuosine reductase QueG
MKYAEMWAEELDGDKIGEERIDDPEDPEDPEEEWQSAGYYSYSSWWENEGYMTHPARPEGDDDDRG